MFNNINDLVKEWGYSNIEEVKADILNCICEGLPNLNCPNYKHHLVNKDFTAEEFADGALIQVNLL